MTSAELQAHPVVVQRMRRHVAAAVVGAGVVGLLVLVGWAADTRGLYAPPPTHQAMTPVTAVLALLLAVGVGVPVRAVTAAAALAVAVLAAWALAAHGGAGEFPPARALFFDRVVAGRSATAALPAVPTAIASLLLAGALLAGVARWRRGTLAASGTALALSTVLLLGQITAVKPLYEAPQALHQRGVSLWSALVLTALTSAVFCPRLPGRTAVLLYGSDGSARTFRAAVAAAIVVPVATWAVMAAWGRQLLPSADQRLAAIVIVDAVVVTLVAGTLLLRLDRIHQERVQQLADAAHTDELTGLANRRALIERGGELLAGARTGVGVVAIDIDGLKLVNDRLGHAAGDAFLRAAARRLQAAVRAGDLVARIGGDEFAVLTLAHGNVEVADLAERIGRHLTGPVAGLPATAVLSASVGAAFGPGGNPAILPELLTAADARMYADKSGRAARRWAEG